MFQHSKLNLAILSSLLSVSISTYANQPNSGSITREAEVRLTPVQNAPVQAVIDLPDIEAWVEDPTNSITLAVKRIQLEGVQSLDEALLRDWARLLENRPNVSLGEIRYTAQRMAEEYHKAGYPLVQAVLPPQRITDGTVIIRILEGKISGAVAENHSRLSDSHIQRYLAQAYTAGKPLYTPQSERALLLMRDLAGVGAINYRLLAGENEGETLLQADLNPANAVSGYIMQDNSGSKSTGEYRTRAALNFNSLFGRGERIALQGMSSFKGVDYGRIGLDLPLGYHGLTLSSNLSHTRYDLGGAFRHLDARGTSDTVDLSVGYPIVRSNHKNVRTALGLEHRRMKDETRSTQTETRKRLDAANFSLNADFTNESGMTTLGMTHTLGKLHIRSLDARAIDAVSAKTQGNYYKLNLHAGRTQWLSDRWTLNAALDGQWANKNLDSAEQMSLGGENAVAAYHSNDLSVDRGLLGHLELRYAVNNVVSLSGFYDVGLGKVRAKPYTNTKNHFVLQGGGVGLNANYKGFFAQTKVAFHKNDALKLTNQKRPRVWLKLGYSF